MSILVMSRVWEKSQHGGANLLMLLAIADFSDDRGRAYPSVGTLAAKCRVKQRAANYSIAELRNSGELHVHVGKGPRGTNLFHIALDRLGVQSAANLQKVAGAQLIAELQELAPLQKNVQPPADNCADPLQHVAYKPSLNHQESSAEPNCPHRELIDLYAKHLHLLAKPRKELWSGKPADAMRARWRWVLTAVNEEDGTRYAETSQQAIAWFDRYFAHVAASDFLTGRSGKWGGCDLGWLMTAGNFAKVIAGNYDNRVTQSDSEVAA